MTAKGNEVATQVPTMDLESFDTFDEALAALQSAGIEGTVITEYGDGFTVADKASLVGVPFVVVGYKTSESDEYGQEFSVLHAVTKDNRKVVITDGSTGLHQQCQKIVSERGHMVGIGVPDGLVRSDYKVEDPREPGKMISATTFYFAGM